MDCHTTAQMHSVDKNYRRVPTPFRSTSPFSDVVPLPIALVGLREVAAHAQHDVVVRAAPVRRGGPHGGGALVPLRVLRPWGRRAGGQAVGQAGRAGAHTRNNLFAWLRLSYRPMV